MNHASNIAAVILAAGHSSRLGAWKPLQPLGSSTFIEEAVRRCRAGGVEDIRVVTGHRAAEIEPVLQKLGVRMVFNPDYDQGMFASVRAGVLSLEPEVTAFFLLPVDLPLVKPLTIRTLLEAHHRQGASITYPCFQGRRGHPPLMATAVVRDLPRDCDGGLRVFLGRFEAAALDLEVMDEAVLLDCDTPADYRRVLAYGLREDLPTRRECEAIWDRYGLPEPLRRHCRLVGELAGRLAVHLHCAGLQLNTNLVAAAGYLHDLAKGQPDHARAGARILEDLGYGRVARVVACHTNIQAEEHTVDESGLLYLTDKFLAGDRLVTLEERFSRALEKFAHQPEVLRAIAKRLKDARIIKQRLEGVLGISLEELLRRYDLSLRPAATEKPQKIYLVRHGAIQPPGAGRRYLGQLDVPLSPEGRSQAEALRERLRQARLAAVYCSDLRRALETAGIIAAPHSLKPRACPELREISLGAWEGLAFDAVRERYPEEYAARGKDFINFRPPAGESFLDCAHRVLPALSAALAATPGDLLLVGHAGVNRILLCLAQGRSLTDLFAIPQPYGCLNFMTCLEFEFAVDP
ncbi:MAG: DVU_1551 family NTP transferase [Desulfobaccales bacterium]